VFEIADSSVLQDRLTKGPIYAKNGVPQYVLVNLRDRCVENHTNPSAPRRRYLERTILAAGEHVRLVAFPDVRIAVDDLLSGRARRSRDHSARCSPVETEANASRRDNRSARASHCDRELQSLLLERHMTPSNTTARLRLACSRANARGDISSSSERGHDG